MMTTTKTLATLGVLAGAYKAKKTLLTHTATLDSDGYVDGVLCTRVEADHLSDTFSASEEEIAMVPTCKYCLARDSRFKK